MKEELHKKTEIQIDTTFICINIAVGQNLSRNSYGCSTYEEGCRAFMLVWKHILKHTGLRDVTREHPRSFLLSGLLLYTPFLSLLSKIKRTAHLIVCHGIVYIE